MQVFTRDTFFELDEHETLLEGLERTGHHVEYQCRSGYCGACRVKLKSGSVIYPKPPLAFLKRDEILPCCCRVQEPIVINVPLKSKL
ncbi:ferredoxin [Halopseudomonas litoralis]|uniref:Ferredoxin n=1 Tax=Halopseudomonas litoralis TaxID=797277 RepID=A0A1H1UNF8_9GAMM|nr:class I ribonucleotide reductase maintenance protein YfaE [Halopseudomonas litoralis]SDS74025.1 ferredoxin [Halopseudomonas litoralis]